MAQTAPKGFVQRDEAPARGATEPSASHQLVHPGGPKRSSARVTWAARRPTEASVAFCEAHVPPGKVSQSAVGQGLASFISGTEEASSTRRPTLLYSALTPASIIPQHPASPGKFHLSFEV